MKKKTRIGLNIGTSSILLVFVLLCMVTFAILSFVSANADYKLSSSLGERTSAYYEASNLAEQQLNAIHQQLDEQAGLAKTAQDYNGRIGELVSDGKIFGDSADMILSYTYEPGSDDDDPTLTWQLAMTDTQALEVTLTLTNPFFEAELFEVAQWKVIQSSPWEDEAPLNLYDGS